MHIRKLPYLIVTLALSLGTAANYADGLVFRIGNSGTYTGQYTSPRYSQTFPQQRIIGPVTSFSHAYGPVPAFGLRNYSQNRKTDLYYRRDGYDDNFNSNSRDKAVGKRNSKVYRNRYGFTSQRRSGADNYQQGYRDGYRDATRSTPKIFNYFGD